MLTGDSCVIKVHSLISMQLIKNLVKVSEEHFASCSITAG